MTYAELSAKPASDYLNPANFQTAMDGAPPASYRAEQYRKGLEFGKNAEYIAIAANSVWGGRTKDGGHVSSCEGIGYHSCTAELLRGFLESGAPLFVYRIDGSKWQLVAGECRQVARD